MYWKIINQSNQLSTACERVCLPVRMSSMVLLTPIKRGETIVKVCAPLLLFNALRAIFLKMLHLYHNYITICSNLLSKSQMQMQNHYAIETRRDF